jgi:hypothetical protein
MTLSILQEQALEDFKKEFKKLTMEEFEINEGNICNQILQCTRQAAINSFASTQQLEDITDLCSALKEKSPFDFSILHEVTSQLKEIHATNLEKLNKVIQGGRSNLVDYLNHLPRDEKTQTKNSVSSSTTLFQNNANIEDTQQTMVSNNNL